MTGAFLFNNEDVLLMKRSENKNIAPGLWACIGGHVEEGEYPYPELSCMREITEETGITEDQIENLQLRYILLRQTGMEIRQHYIFIGESKTRNMAHCTEGELHWIRFGEIMNREMSLTLRLMLKHYIEHRDYGGIWTGTVLPDKEEMIWGRL
jgi:8-oxo-dGTP diphosphatase